MQLDVRAEIPVTLLQRKALFLRGLALCCLKTGIPERPVIDRTGERGFFFKRLSGADAENFRNLCKMYDITSAHLVEAALAAVDHSPTS